MHNNIYNNIQDLTIKLLHKGGQSHHQPLLWLGSTRLFQNPDPKERQMAAQYDQRHRRQVSICTYSALH